MRPLLPKHRFFFSSLFSFSFSISSSPARALLLQISHFSTSSYSSPRNEESQNVKVLVWWNSENCRLPAGVNIFRFTQVIIEVLRFNGIMSPIQIRAFGDITKLSKVNQETLSSKRINFTHIPNCEKEIADRSLLVSLLSWVSKNPPPAYLFLISESRGFAGILHQIRMSNYKILLAIPGKAPIVLCRASSITWQWTALLKGKNLIGKHFDQPPGPFDSRYRSCKAFDTQVRHILKSYRKGLSVTDLRVELTKRNVPLEKDFYEDERFSRFLLSLPNIQLDSQGKGVFVVRLIPSESLEPSENSVVPKLNGKGKSSFPPSAERHAGQPPNELRKSSLGSEKAVNVATTQLSENQLPSMENELQKFSPVDDSAVDKKPGESTESYSKSQTFFSWIRSWWPFRKSSGKSDDFSVHQEKVVSHSEESKL